ncbi:MAG: ComF family protein [Gammaproteobacteria bacterium]|nr:ComF family protein [Gammaproteobacteria bacterium]
MDGRTIITAWIKRLKTHCYWPGHCVFCGQTSDTARDCCAACAQDLPLLQNACTACALPLNGPFASGVLCGACQKKHPIFDSAHAAWIYEEPVRSAIHRFKYDKQLAMGRALSELWLQQCTSISYQNIDALIPVPLHHSRERPRGFNQAALIAYDLAKHWRLPVLRASCQRIKATTEQKDLSAKQRRSNVRGAFKIKGVIPKRVAIVDDVMTSGSTANELARVLKRAGAQHVEVWALARAVYVDK